jgi:ribose 5-phosphate isomerase B
MSIQEEIMRFVADVLEQDKASLRLEDHFVHDLAASSIDIVTLVMRVEQHYGLGETPDDQLAQIATVGDLVELVRGLQLGGGSSFAEDSEQAYTDIAISSDHAGRELLVVLVPWLRKNGYEVLDLGPDAGQSVDYPDYAHHVTQAIIEERAQTGILICGSGLGMSIAANRSPGIRAALVSEPVSARLARQHNNANIVCLGARLVGEEMARACLDVFLTTSFEPGDDGRHRRRIQRIETAGSPSS